MNNQLTEILIEMTLLKLIITRVGFASNTRHSLKMKYNLKHLDEANGWIQISFKLIVQRRKHT